MIFPYEDWTTIPERAGSNRHRPPQMIYVVFQPFSQAFHQVSGLRLDVTTMTLPPASSLKSLSRVDLAKQEIAWFCSLWKGMGTRCRISTHVSTLLLFFPIDIPLSINVGLIISFLPHLSRIAYTAPRPDDIGLNWGPIREV